MGAQIRRLLTGAVIAAAVLVAVAVSAPAATAGTYNVYYTAGPSEGCSIFAPSTSSAYVASCGSDGLVLSAAYGQPPGGTEGNYTASAPAGITITGATPSYAETPVVGTLGWGSGDFYSGGGVSWSTGANNGQPDPPFSSSYWGFQLLCSSAVTSCNVTNLGNWPTVRLTAVTLEANEAQNPSISPAAGNLLDQSGYVWNPSGDDWSLATSNSDPSGVCQIYKVVNGTVQAIWTEPSHNTTTWDQCPDGNGTTTPSSGLDTRSLVSVSGSFTLAEEATDAAGNAGATATKTIHVDNEPVSVSLGTRNDANPTVWVNHAVQVTAGAGAGPSGISSTTCAIDGGQGFTYPSGGFVVDGDGNHAVSCTGSNGAVGPQGQHNSGTATEQIKIDEAAPAVAFAPVNPSDPDELVVNTSDAESDVASGSITVQGPHAKAARTIPTTLSGGQLLAHFNDGGHNGKYTFTATSCDAVSNCASAQEILHFPIRLGSRGLISFRKIFVPAKTVHKRILVGVRHRTVERREKIGGHYRRVKRTITIGGHLRRVRVHVRRNRRCGHHVIHVRVHGHRRRRRVTACRRKHLRTKTHSRQHLGHRIKVYGLLRTEQGRPLAHARVIIATRPTDRGGRYHRVGVTHSDKHGRWMVKLPGGPSRTIRARYPGANVVEPSTVRAQLTVPAGIHLRISPHVLPWAHVMHVRGHLVGRYIPHDGVALRLLVRYPHAHEWTVLQALRTNRHGAFRFGWSYRTGRGVASYPFRVASTSKETDYPYAAGSSGPVRVTFGRATPKRRHHHHRHRRPAPAPPRTSSPSTPAEQVM